MRFDDSSQPVLSIDMTGGARARPTWRRAIDHAETGCFPTENSATTASLAREASPAIVARPAFFDPAARGDVPDKHGPSTIVGLEPRPAIETTSQFSFETDATGFVIGVDGVTRDALAGLSFAQTEERGLARLDGVATGAFRRRSSFEAARLEVGGASDAAGSWRLNGEPAFQSATGRFTGFRGIGRRPRVDESAGPPLRHAHESRTPADAFAVPVEPIKVERASTVTWPLIERIVDDLAPLAMLRGVRVTVDGEADATPIIDHVVERLLGRLLVTIVAAGEVAETIRLSVHAGPTAIAIAIDKPRLLAGLGVDALLALDGAEGAQAGVSLIGTGFALRVARNLASELGGVLELEPARFTLRLPVARTSPVGPAVTI